MRKIFLIAFLLTSVAAFSQTAQFGDWYFRQRIGVNKPTNNLHPNSVFEVNDSSTSSLFRIYKNGAIQSFKFKNNSAEDSILTTDQFGNFKLRLKPSTVLPWDSITSKPALLISGNNLADVSNVATARTNLSVYSIATVNDSLLNHYTKSQADARFKSIDWFPSVANVTGLPDSLTNLQARIQTKLTKSDADTYYPSIQRMQDSLAAVQARVQTKEPFISPGTSAQYWRGDKSWQTLDKSAVGLSAVPNVDATNPANISQSATYRFVTDSEKSTWNAKQNALGYTPENTANKATDFSTVNNTLYPTVQAVSNAITSATSSYIPLSQKGANNGVATLDVGGKVPFSQLPAALMIYKGTWNVSTNTPTLADGTGVTGWVYIVSVGGTINTGSGNITYSAGDYAIHNGSTWEKSAGTNNVASVNGQQGVVNLTTANISESGNLYYTDARTRAALSFTPGSGAYNSSTGVITIPTNTNQLTNGAGFITGFTETDPTIYAWAKAATKPSYSYSEITSTPTTWAWSNITGIPTTFTPSAHSHGNADITDVAWAKITGAPAFITGNQTITLSGDISGSGTNAITTTIGALKVTNAMLAGSIDYSKMNSATVPTWNQSTTGNAATSSSSPLLSSFSAYAFNSSQTPTSLNYGIQTFFVGPEVGEGSWQNYGSVINLRTYSGGGASMQMYIPYSPTLGGTGMQVRFGNYDVAEGDSWTSWKTLLATDNYNSYAPSLTGVGASGNWGINITGNAATVTNGVYTTSSYTNPSWITSLDYSKLIGTIPTWNQNTTGSAATLSAVLSSTLGGAGVVNGILKANGSGVVSAAVSGDITALISGTYVDLTTTQTVGGAKTLSSELTLQDNLIFTNSLSRMRIGATNYAIQKNDGSANYVVLDNATGNMTLSGALIGTSFSLSGNINQGGGTASNTAGFNNNLYLESTIPSITLSNTAANTGKFTLGVTGGQFGLWNNGTSAYEIKIDPLGSGLIELNRGTRASGELYTTLTTESTSTSTGALRSAGGLGIASSARIGGSVFSHSGFTLNPIGSGGWDRRFGFLGMSSTSRGGFGAFGSDDNLEYYYVGTDYASNVVRFNLATSSTTFYGGINGTSAQFSSILNVNGSSSVEELNVNGDIALVGTANRYIQIGSNSNYYWRLKSVGDNFQINMGADVLTAVQFNYPSGAASFASTATSTGFIRSGSSDSYFLLGGGGHVLASTYATTASLSSYATTASLTGYVNTSTNQLEIGGNKSFLGAIEVLSIKTTGGPGTPGVLKFGTKTNDTVFTGGSAYSIPVNIDGTTYYIRLWAGIN